MQWRPIVGQPSGGLYEWELLPKIAKEWIIRNSAAFSTDRPKSSSLPIGNDEPTFRRPVTGRDDCGKGKDKTR
jgi:hypothetical protein